MSLDMKEINRIVAAIRSFGNEVTKICNDSEPRAYFSNWIQHDLSGTIELFNDPSPGKFIPMAVKTGGRVLDFGCGNAPHKSILEQNGFEWFGLDYEGRIDQTTRGRTEKLETLVSKYDGVTFPFSSESFDAVWSFQSLEHIHSPEETFKEISRVLKQGGILFGSTSFLESYHARSTFCYTPY